MVGSIQQGLHRQLIIDCDGPHKAVGIEPAGRKPGYKSIMVHFKASIRLQKQVAGRLVGCPELMVQVECVLSSELRWEVQRRHNAGFHRSVHHEQGG
jgi:hypothetical protein